MFLLAGIIAGVATALAVVLVHLRKAPLGFEDDNGFHIVQQLRGSAIIRHRKRDAAMAGELKGARAH